MYLRNFQGVIQTLAEQGHEVVITTSPHDRKVPSELRKLANSLETGSLRVRFGLTHEREDLWAPICRFTRNIGNLLRYRRREYRNAPALAARAESRAGRIWTLLLPRALTQVPGVANALRRVVQLIDSGLPADKTIVRELESTRPDALILTPMVDLETEQLEWVRAARVAEVPTCLLVASWDNLTNKGRVHLLPDRVVVWNEFQKKEAMEMHDIPADRIVTTGAQLYDEWFERKSLRDYESFCRTFGFDPAQPTILYCGSSIFIAHDEAKFVRVWLDWLRSSPDPALRSANILVRPHPMHQVPFNDFDASPHEKVAVHPKTGGMPVLESGKADFFDALYHCALVVGINTSALIEAAILGKRSFTVADPRYQRTQEGTLHFKYLIEGGILEKAPDFPTHLEQLAAELSRGTEGRRDLSNFVKSFVRPHGLDRPVTPVVAETVMSMPSVTPQKAPAVWQRLATGILFFPLAILAWFPERGAQAAVEAFTRACRFGLFNVARLKRCDAATLVARRTPLDYPRTPISILVTSPKENLSRTRSVMNEPWTVHWIENVIEPGDVLYDVGANVGAFSLVAAKAHDHALRVFAFEPSFVTYAALCRNILENGCERIITPMPIALTEDKGNTVFKYRSLISGASEHAVGEQNLASKDFKETKPAYQQRMLAVPLDSLTEDFQLEPPNHIKLDVDGMELQVLRGAAATLANGAVKTILIDARQDKDSDRVTEYLRQLGYGLAAKFNGDDGIDGFHAVFARDSAGVGATMARCRLADRKGAPAGSGDAS